MTVEVLIRIDSNRIRSNILKLKSTIRASMTILIALDEGIAKTCRHSPSNR